MKHDFAKMIEGYSDMSAEEKLKAIEGFEFEEPKQDETAAKLKESLNKACSQAAEYKRRLAEKQTESEKAEQERKERDDAIQEELKTLRREKSVSTYKASYIGLGYSDELAQSTAEAMVDGNTDIVFANQKVFMAQHDKDIKANVLKSTPPPVGGDSGVVITKEQFQKMSYGEMVELAKNNPELYKKFTE